MDDDQPAAVAAPDPVELASAEAKLRSVRDLAGRVGGGELPAAYICGPAGSGKTHAACEELSRLGVAYRDFGGRMTGRGLYEALARHPRDVHVVEDAGRFVRSPDAAFVLSWAIRPPDGPDGRGRSVHWVTALLHEQFRFAGGVILLATRPPGRYGPLRDLIPMLPVFAFGLSAGETVARMRSVAAQGYRNEGAAMTPAECAAVCEFVLRECESYGRKPDLRLLTEAFRYFLEARRDGRPRDWRGSVDRRITERRLAFWGAMVAEGLSPRPCRDLDVAFELRHLPRERRAREWRERTGKTESSLFACLRDPGCW